MGLGRPHDPQLLGPQQLTDPAFPPDRRSRVFGIAPGRDFSHAFVAGLIHRFRAKPPEALARVTIFTNTQRSQRRLETRFTDFGAFLLPRIRVIGDLASDPGLATTGPVPEPPLAVRLRVTQLVRRLLETERGLAPPSAAFDLAGGLMELLDEMAGRDLPAVALDGLDVDASARHWQTTLRFLQLIAPMLADNMAPGPEARQRAAVRSLAALWARRPPADPVIVAGSTGSRAPTALLMQTVLDLPNGALVLPGFDRCLDSPTWEELAEKTSADHPQSGFARLGRQIGFDTADVARWDDEPPPTAREELLSLALRPAPVTDSWRTLGPALDPQMGAALDGVSLLTAPNEHAEASAIATALREGIDGGRTAALITPDGSLARRVTAQLARWGILPDESAGQPLNLTPEGVFFGLIAAWLDRPDPVLLTALLKHPLTASQGDRGPHLARLRKLDTEFLRDCGPVVDWPALLSFCKSAEQPWATWIARALTPELLAPTAPLTEHVARHRAIAESLATGPETPDPVQPNPMWSTTPGRAMDRVFASLTAASDAGGPIGHRDYSAVLDTLTRAESKRPDGYIPDQRVLIWGQLEARVQSADLIVLGGLNEGTWPAQPPPDPWLNRKMRADLGISLPERRIGLAAHDFQQAAAAPCVVLSRPARLENTPTVPSRWLVRLENLVNGSGPGGQQGWKTAEKAGSRLLARARALDLPDQTVPAEPRPAPIPPVNARPTTLHVTEAETLVRNPFAFYARKILRLRELPRLGRPPDMRDRGIAVHAFLETFLKQTRDAMPEDAQAAYLRTLQEVLETVVPWPAERQLWHARLARLAQTFIATEEARRSIAQPARIETKGCITIDGFARELKLAARADRIDVAPDGSIAIYDYKTTKPSPNQIKTFAKQLPLEARIAEKGGFLDGQSGPATRLEIIGLNQLDNPYVYDLSQDDLNTIWDEFLRLVAHYEDPKSGYPSRLRVMKEGQEEDYDHLARRGEWADGDDPTPVEVP